MAWITTLTVNSTTSTSVQVNKPGTVSDLAKGSTVVVHGTTHGNTITAQSINQSGHLRAGPAASPTP